MLTIAFWLVTQAPCLHLALTQTLPRKTPYFDRSILTNPGFVPGPTVAWSWKAKLTLHQLPVLAPHLKETITLLLQPPLYSLSTGNVSWDVTDIMEEKTVGWKGEFRARQRVKGRQHEARQRSTDEYYVLQWSINFQNQSACLKIRLTEITKKLYIDTFLKTVSNTSQLLSHLLKQHVTLCGGPDKWEKRG